MSLIFKSADDEGLELFDQIIAMVGIDFQGDRLGKIQAEDAQDGLAIHHMAAHAQVDVKGVAVGDVHEGSFSSGTFALFDVK